MSQELTNIDIRILEEMQKDATISTTELAERVGLSQSPCWRRLQRLRSEGYIASQVALLDPKKFGQNLYIFATLKVASLNEEQRSKFMRKIELTPEILECHTMFGECDLMMKIVAESLEWYQNFVFKTIMKLPGVIDVHSDVTLTAIKQTTAIPIRGQRAL